MGEKWHQLTWDDRIRIETLLKAGQSKQYIADEVKVHISTIYNELQRGQYEHLNSDLTTEIRYSPDIAHKKYRANLAAKGPDLKIGNDHELMNDLEKIMLEDNYSPAAALAKVQQSGKQYSTMVSTKTVYNYVGNGIFLHLTNKDLPEKGKRKRQYNRVKPRARALHGDSIEKRPSAVATRDTIGHWEMDCVEGKKSTKKVLLVLSERSTRDEIMILMPDQTAASVVQALDRLERRLGKLFYKLFLTITVDNGSEFSDVVGMTKAKYRKGPRTHIYYCHPWSSWERGTNENINKMIRRVYPKGTDFTKVKPSEVKAAEAWVNNYPRGIHGYKSAQNLMDEWLASQKPTFQNCVASS